MKKNCAAVTALLVSFTLIFNIPISYAGPAAPLLTESTAMQPQTAPSEKIDKKDSAVTQSASAAGSSDDFMMQSAPLSAADASCSTEMCGLSAGQTVSGTIFVEPNLGLNPDTRKVSYYLNGTLSSRQYETPFTWGGSAGFDTTTLQNGDYTLSGAISVKDAADKLFSITFTVNNTGAPDTTPPVLSGVTATSITSTGATIKWTSDETSDSQVEYRVQGTTAWSATSVNASLVRDHSVALTGLSADTNYEYRVKSKDPAGNLATQATISTFKTTDGSTPPSGDFVGVTNGATISGVVNIGPNLAVHPDVRKVSYYLDGSKSGKVYLSPFYWGGTNGDGTGGFDTRTIADGNHTLSMGYTDSTGDHSVSVSFIVNNSVPDTTAPVISAVTAANITASGATITWTTNEASDSQVEYRVQGTTAWTATSVNASLVTNHSVALSGLNANTAYEYRVKSKDQAGNLATQATISNFTTPNTTDSTAPVISGVSASNITSTGATIGWTTNEASDSQVEYRVQGTTAWSATSINAALVTNHSIAISGLNAGTVYEYRVKSKDAAGNLATQAPVSTLTTASTTDTTGPVISDVSATTITSTGATIRWTTDEASDSQVEYRAQGTGTFIATSVDAALVTNHTLLLTGLSAGITYEYRVKSKDASGNLTVQSPLSTVTTAGSDTTVPVISGVSASNITASGATINWTTNEGSDSQVEYRVQGTTAWSATTVNAAIVLDHSLALTGLNAGTTYEYRVKSKDQSGNLATQATISTLTTTSTTDTAAPVISAVSASNITATGATIGWTTNEASDSQVEYRVQGTTAWTATSINAALVTNHSIAISGLNAGTVYEYRVKSKDAAGNLATQAPVSTLTTTSTTDTTAPVISGVSASNITASAATIGWTTDEASDSQVEYRVQGTTAWTATSINAALVTSHSLALSGLSASTVYEYRVKSKDAAGNLATQATISTLTTSTSGGDTTVPVISGVSVSNIASSSATINWTTNENSDSQVEYRVQGTTAWTATSVNATLVTNHSIAISGLSASTIYEYRVVCQDATGNLATQAAAATFTTANASSGTGDFSGVTSGATIKGVVNIGPNLTVHPGIQKVAYYLNGSKSGKVYSAPFFWGGPNGDGTNGFDTRTIVDGSHTLSMAYTDGSGEHNVSITFKVNNTVDGTEFPVITEVEAWGVTSSQATIIWRTNEPSDSQVEYRVKGSSSWSATGVDSSLEVNHWVTVPGLSANTQYEFRVKSKDPEGNLTTQPAISEFTTKPASADTVPPKILIVSWTDITSTVARINWRTDEDSDSRLRWRAQGSTAWTYTSLNPTMMINHSILLTGLSVGTPYEVQVFSQDPSGNLVAQETVSRFSTADIVSSTKLLGVKEGDTVTGVVNIGPDLAAFGTITKTEYYVDGINRGTSLTSPFTWGGSSGFPSRELTNTPHQFKVVITDETGPHEINLNFTAQNTDIPPSTEFTGITPGATVSGIVNIGVDLNKHPDVRKVQYYLDFAQSGKVFISPYLWGGFDGDGTVGFDTRTISNNPHMLIMFYTDSTGDHEGRIDFIVNN